MRLASFPRLLHSFAADLPSHQDFIRDHCAAPAPQAIPA